MKQKPRILITNDDGIHAPGIKHLWKALAEHADLFIVAPETEKSGVGLAITLRKPLYITSTPWHDHTPAWKVNGTPADCVRLALSVVLDRAPDLIVSGINRGSNSGRNVLYSGTVGGIIEGALRDVPGIAFSCSNFFDPDYQAVEHMIYPIVSHLLDHPLPQGSFLNVNFPENVPMRGLKLARQGMGYWVEDPQKRAHPEGQSYFWLGGQWKHHEEHEESDVHLLNQGFAVAVPIRVNELTDYSSFASRKNHFDQLFQTQEV